MKKLLIAATALSSLVIFANAAKAADPVDMTYDWSGAYIGLQGGYLAANVDMEDRSAGGAIIAQSTPDFDGGFGGLHLGYNMQLTSIVLGLETEINAVGAGSGFETARNAGGLPIPPNQHKASLDWSGSTRLRAGFAADRFLPFITAGVAYGGLNSLFDHAADNASVDKTMVGLTVGAGLDYAVTDALILGVEYRYTDYGTVKANNFPFFPTERQKVKLETNDIRVTASFKF
jgi:outer membrane immunogenic protein